MFTTPPTDTLQQSYNLSYNKFTTNGQTFATSQHLDMSRCWALALRCGKFVVQQVVELLWACPLVVLYNISVDGVRVVEFGTKLRVTRKHPESANVRQVWLTLHRAKTYPLCNYTSIRSYARFPPFRCRSSVAVSPLPLDVAVAVAYLFAVYGCNGTEFSYVILQNNGILQRQNGETATEWWKPGIIHYV